MVTLVKLFFFSEHPNARVTFSLDDYGGDIFDYIFSKLAIATMENLRYNWVQL